MAGTRTFIAVDVPGAVRKRAADLVERLRAGDVKVNWVVPTNMHLTLKFLGDLGDSKLVDVCRAVSDAVAPFSPWELLCQGAGAFPDATRPRTVWIGVRDGSDPLVALHAAIDEGLAKLGFSKERRRFQPHLTIGRVRGSGANQLELGKAIVSHVDFPVGRVSVNEVLVFGSQLSRRGPSYEILARAPLGKRGS